MVHKGPVQSHKKHTLKKSFKRELVTTNKGILSRNCILSLGFRETLVFQFLESLLRAGSLVALVFGIADTPRPFCWCTSNVRNILHFTAWIGPPISDAFVQTHNWSICKGGKCILSKWAIYIFTCLWVVVILAHLPVLDTLYVQNSLHLAVVTAQNALQNHVIWGRWRLGVLVIEPDYGLKGPGFETEWHPHKFWYFVLPRT